MTSWNPPILGVANDHPMPPQALNLLRGRQEERLGDQQQLPGLDGAREHQASALGWQQHLAEENLELGILGDFLTHLLEI